MRFHILSKGILYARNSRLVSDKFQLGFRYPCDGPGIGGTCQISPKSLFLGPHIFSCILDVEFSISSVIPLFLEDAIRCVGYIQYS